MGNNQESLLQKLLQNKLISKEQIALVLKRHKETGDNAVECLINENILQEKQIISFLVRACGVHYINLENIEIDPQAVAEIPLELIKSLKVVPIRCARNMLVVAMMDPYDSKTLEHLSEATVHRIIPFVSQRKQLIHFIGQLGAGTLKKPNVIMAPAASEGMPFVEKYTFETFVVGKNSEFPFAMAMSVAKAPGKTYNPFFLYSNVGLGKTHLMNAIGNYMLKKSPNTQNMYVTCEYFCSRVVEAIKDNQIDSFREIFRRLDVLLIDDIEFLRDRDTAQEEFFHIFNNMVQGGKQIVVTSDRAPSELSVLKERLQSRFMGGTIACIEPPDLETRMAIIDKKTVGFDLPDDVRHLLAENFASSVRDLEGAIKTLLSIHQVTKSPIDIDLVKRALQEMGRRGI